MIKLTSLNILGQPNDILDLKKGFDKTLNCQRGFAEDCLKVYENSTDDLSNNLRLNEISIFIFFQFCCKINRNQLEIVVDATYGQHTY